MTAPVLRTPGEVAAFLAENVMGWEPSDRSSTSGFPRFVVLYPDYVSVWHERSNRYWDPWRNVADAIEALEEWVEAKEGRDSGLDFPCEESRWATFVMDEDRNYNWWYGAQTPSESTCRALCTALGATVEIDDAERFQVGDRVRWSSQSHAFRKSKRGRVLAVVPPGRDPDSCIRETLRSDFIPGRIMFDGTVGRSHESYVVSVGNKLYWPRVRHLERDDE